MDRAREATAEEEVPAMQSVAVRRTLLVVAPPLPTALICIITEEAGHCVTSPLFTELIPVDQERGDLRKLNGI